MPAYRTVLYWFIKGDEDGAPDALRRFLQNYVRAREAQQDALMDELIDIADDSRNDWISRLNEHGKVEWVENPEAIARSKLRVDTRIRAAERMAPKKYGAKVDVNHGVQPDSPLAGIMRRAAMQPLIPGGDE